MGGGQAGDGVTGQGGSYIKGNGLGNFSKGNVADLTPVFVPLSKLVQVVIVEEIVLQ